MRLVSIVLCAGSFFLLYAEPVSQLDHERPTVTPSTHINHVLQQQDSIQHHYTIDLTLRLLKGSSLQHAEALILLKKLAANQTVSLRIRQRALYYLAEQQYRTSNVTEAVRLLSLVTQSTEISRVTLSAQYELARILLSPSTARNDLAKANHLLQNIIDHPAQAGDILVNDARYKRALLLLDNESPLYDPQGAVELLTIINAYDNSTQVHPETATKALYKYAVCLTYGIGIKKDTRYARCILEGISKDPYVDAVLRDDAENLAHYITEGYTESI